jgi:hypothetical protein
MPALVQTKCADAVRKFYTEYLAVMSSGIGCARPVASETIV